jgi:hypothetical protein
MKNKVIILAALIGGVFATAATAADNAVVTGAAGGAVTGAIVGGPVGAAVGGVVGMTVGALSDPPPERVVTYVREQPAPERYVVVERPVVVGERVPDTVVLTPVPDAPSYAYAFVNDRRVLVDPQTNTIVQIYE